MQRKEDLKTGRFPVVHALSDHQHHHHHHHHHHLHHYHHHLHLYLFTEFYHKNAHPKSHD